MPSKIHDQPPVMDFDSFVARTEGDSGLILELINLFQTESPRQYALVLAATQANDATALQAAAHALKGAVSNFSAGPATNAAAVLEEMGKSRNMADASAACSKLSYEIERLQLVLAGHAKEVSL